MALLIGIGAASCLLFQAVYPVTKAIAFGGRDRLEMAQIIDSHGDGPGHGSGAAAAGGGSAGGAMTDGSALRRLLWEIEKRTSIEVAPEAALVRVSDDNELHRHPLLYWTGDRAFAMPSEEDLVRLRRHLVMGGMLILDSAEGRAGGGFDQSARALVAKLFPNQPLHRLPEDHVLFRSFYLLRVPAGRVIAQPYLEAVIIGGTASAVGSGNAASASSGSNGSGSNAAGSNAAGLIAPGSGSPVSSGRAAIVYSQNDLGGAWARDRFGQWMHEVVPGGEGQRELAFRLGVNLVMYALCLDYKADQVHVPFIMRRRMWQAPMPQYKINPEPQSPAPSP